MKIEITKNHLSKIVLTAFCLLMITYNQCGYADMRKFLYNDKTTGQEYLKIIVEDGSVTSEMAEEISSALADTAHPVGSLRFFGANFFPGTFATIMGALQSHPTLRELELEFDVNSDPNNDCLGEEDEQRLISAISANITGLCDFMLFGHSGRGTGFWGALIAALSTNPNLTNLSLIAGNIGNYEMGAIAELLRTNRLIILDLAGNLISDDGARTIAAALRENNTVTGMGLNGNQITGTGWQAIFESLACNVAAQLVDIDDNSLSEEQLNLISFIIQRNLLIKKLPDWLKTRIKIGEHGPSVELNNEQSAELTAEERKLIEEIREFQNRIEQILAPRLEGTTEAIVAALGVEMPQEQSANRTMESMEDDFVPEISSFPHLPFSSNS